MLMKGGHGRGGVVVVAEEEEAAMLIGWWWGSRGRMGSKVVGCVSGVLNCPWKLKLKGWSDVEQEVRMKMLKTRLRMMGGA